MKTYGAIAFKYENSSRGFCGLVGKKAKTALIDEFSNFHGWTGSSME